MAGSSLPHDRRVDAILTTAWHAKRFTVEPLRVPRSRQDHIDPVVW